MQKNNFKKIILFLSVLLIQENVSAQYFPNYDLQLLKGTVPYIMPWVGGLNNPQFSAADLNNDGIQDLVIFDRTGNKLLTFTNSGDSGMVDYHYAPKYEKNFPKMDAWCLLLDFNCDNIADIFCHATLGAQVYKGYYNTDNELCFTSYSKLLKFQGFTGPLNIFISQVDIPAFVDVDNDNDIDILTFEINGGWMDYYQNMSQDLGYGCDSFKYELTEQCWGLMYEPSTSEAKWLNQSCPFRTEGIVEKPNDNLQNEKGGTRHSGSTTLAFDNDGDGDKELIIGDISFSDLVYLTNGGSISSALLTDQDTSFPVYSVPANIDYFPAAFYLDLNNDGVKDIVSAPNTENGETDVACSWYYKNIDANTHGVFIYQTDSFLTGDMIDVGSGAAPVFVDLNNDGLTDMLIANRSAYGSNSTIEYLENVGADTLAIYKVITKNWMNLSSLNLKALYPAFGDLDNDGKKEMVLGNENGTLLYYENTGGGSGVADNFVLNNPAYFTIDVGGYSTPEIVDVNNDGLLDLVIGEENGSLNYCRNLGTVSVPDFSNMQASFGNVIVQQGGQVVGFSVPCFVKLDSATTWTLLVGCEGGNVFQYDNIENNLGSNFNLVDTSFANIQVGSFSSPTAADISNDGIPEIAIGNYRGGVTVYDTSSAHNYSSVNYFSNNWMLNLFPNPASDYVEIKANHEISQAEIFDELGRKVLSVTVNNSKQIQLNTALLPNALYIIRLTGAAGNCAIKFLKN
ncbi:MAG: T9SS type A sorting domain-containing protein [Bacteroidota bacterium]